MSFTLTPDQAALVDGARAVIDRFDDAYWLNKDRSGDFPTEFQRAMAEGGWLGVCMPEEYGGSGLGLAEAALLMHEVANSPGGFSAASAIHINIFTPRAIVEAGTEAQKQRFLPPLITGAENCCLAVTEPDVGLDTSKIKTRAVPDGNGYRLDGRKMWTTTAQEADRILIVARAPGGVTLFYAPYDRSAIETREIDKMGRKAVDTNALFIDGLKVDADDRIGAEGDGLKILFQSLNAERVLFGIEAVGLGRQALARAARYANERVVFDRPIGKNQGVQLPLAAAWAELEAAYWLARAAADLYDRGLPCGPQANAAKYLGAESGFRACEASVMAHGGMGYAREFHVERFFREAMIARLAPVSRELGLAYIAERALGLPKSY